MQTPASDRDSFVVCRAEDGEQPAAVLGDIAEQQEVQAHPLPVKLREDGPLVCVAVIAVPRGRWEREFQRRSASGRAAMSELAKLRGFAGANAPTDTGGSSMLAGFAVIRAWHFTTSPPASAQASVMMRALKTSHRRSLAVGFLQHCVVESAQCSEPLPLIGEEWRRRAPRQLGGELWRSAMLASLHCATPGPHGLVGARSPVQGTAELSALWSNSVNPKHRGQCFAWPMWTPLARALTAGQWGVDVTAVLPRATLPQVAFPLSLSRRQRAEFVQWSMTNQVSCMPVQSEPDVQVNYLAGGGCVRRFDVAHIVGAIGAMSTARFVDPSVSRLHLKYMFPNKWQIMQRVLDNSGFIHPSRNAVERGRFRLDCASMLLWREWYATHGPLFRYVAFDASPQQPGIEVFCTVERVFKRSNVMGIPASAIPFSAVIQRRLPLATLGQGRAGLPDKVQSHVHQTWLDYGHSPEALRNAFEDVRQCLSDMGTEWGIGGYADIVDVYLRRRGFTVPAAGFAATAPSHLFPRALEVPGPQHIIDGIIKDSLAQIPWWPAWVKSSKVIAQFLHSCAHRDKLAEVLRMRCTLEQEELSSAVNSLRTGIDKFAHWRWKTLDAVTRGLIDKEVAVRLSCGALAGPESLGLRDGAVASAVMQAATTDAMWEQTKAIKHIIGPLMALAAWIRGCACHEHLCKANISVSCVWKGCRAWEFASKLHSVREDIAALREMLTPGQFGQSVLTADVQEAMTRTLAGVVSKLQWVHQAPYLVWQVRKRRNGIGWESWLCFSDPWLCFGWRFTCVHPLVQ